MLDGKSLKEYGINPIDAMNEIERLGNNVAFKILIDEAKGIRENIIANLTSEYKGNNPTYNMSRDTGILHGVNWLIEWLDKSMGAANDLRKNGGHR